jgi:hypothetical protein
MTTHSRPNFLWTSLVAAALSATLAWGCGGGPSVSSKGDRRDGKGGSAGSGTGEGGEGTGGTTIIPPDECEPKTCEELEKNCGKVADGCGEIIECGECEGGHVCGFKTANVCSTDDDIDDLCMKVSEEDACDGKECGVEGDGCGGTYECGECGRDEACGIEEAFQCDVVPDGTDDDCPAMIPSCADVDAECGIIGNGCGGTIDCDMETGGCDNDEVCGFGGPQKCGAPPSCTPTPAATACAGKCGIVSNGCGVEVNGGIIDCSAMFPCPNGETCGGGGVANECGAGGSSDCTPVSQATACAGKTCGAASDGCTGSYTCGTGCGTGQACIAGSCQGTTCTPIPQATACAGMECGQVGNGCSGTYDCGMCPTGESCGLRTAFSCDPTPGNCTPRTPVAACAGKECGIVYDGCGTAAANQIDCGAVNGGCQSGEFCGLTAPFQCGTPVDPPCTPTTTCTSLGWTCGTAVDNCGNTMNCGSCGPLETCIGGITGPATCQTGTSGGTCTLCSAVPACTGQPQRTRLTGKVVTPGKADNNTANQLGVPNAFVYILRTNNLADLPAISSGIGAAPATACERCTDQDLGPVLVSGMTNATGNFQLEGNVPVGQEFILVVKVGKFRRAVRHTLPANAACTTTNIATALPANLTRLPRNQTDGLAVNIPKMAISTGEVDAMECVLQKMGIANSEFTRPQLTSGRIHLYRANGAWPDQQSQNCQNCSNQSCRQTNCGGTGSNGDRTNFLNAISDTRIHDNTNGRINEYDMVIYDCEGGGWDDDFSERNTYGANVRSYVNRGGRMFGSHWSYSWIDGNGNVAYAPATAANTGLTAAGTWTSGGTFPSSGTGAIALGRPRASPRIQNFADWMSGHSIAAAPGYTFGITEPRGQNTGLGNSSEEFVYRTDGDMRTQQMSFNTPYAAPAANICGRVAYSGFHVSVGNTTNAVFPNHCTGDLTSQEKVLLYMLFDLGACVGEDPDPPGCTTQACPGGGLCGTRPDGCGGTQQCGCPQGQACINGTCQNQGCVPTTCQAEGIICSTISNGCGGALTCACPVCTPISQAQACAGKTCGYASDGCSGVYDCGGACTPTCDPLDACPQGVDCGVISDGCSGTLNCGNCPPPAVCGGAGQANRCGVPMCDPLTCEDQGAECGMVGDGCGGSDDCGVCPPGQYCTTVNGMGNRCAGCEPQSCDDVDAECGIIGDGCGGTRNCGPCPQGQICGAEEPNKCGDGPGCTPRDCDDANAECGIIGDGCGGQVDCGPCQNGQICGVTTPFQCGDPPGCDPATCESEGAECGLIADGCGDLVDCGACPSGMTCGLSEANKCTGVR